MRRDLGLPRGCKDPCPTRPSSPPGGCFAFLSCLATSGRWKISVQDRAAEVGPRAAENLARSLVRGRRARIGSGQIRERWLASSSRGSRERTPASGGSSLPSSLCSLRHCLRASVAPPGVPSGQGRRLTPTTLTPPNAYLAQLPAVHITRPGQARRVNLGNVRSREGQNRSHSRSRRRRSPPRGAGGTTTVTRRDPLACSRRTAAATRRARLLSRGGRERRNPPRRAAGGVRDARRGL